MLENLCDEAPDESALHTKSIKGYRRHLLMSSEKVHCLQFTYPNFQHPSPCFFYQVTHLESTLRQVASQASSSTVTDDWGKCREAVYISPPPCILDTQGM